MADRADVQPTVADLAARARERLQTDSYPATAPSMWYREDIPPLLAALDVLTERLAAAEQDNERLREENKRLEWHRTQHAILVDGWPDAGRIAARAERAEARVTALEEALREAWTVYERATFDTHDLEWSRLAAERARAVLGSTGASSRDRGESPKSRPHQEPPA